MAVSGVFASCLAFVRSVSAGIDHRGTREDAEYEPGMPTSAMTAIHLRHDVSKHRPPCQHQCGGAFEAQPPRRCRSVPKLRSFTRLPCFSALVDYVAPGSRLRLLFKFNGQIEIRYRILTDPIYQRRCTIW
jgi:hypothetical protein